MRLVISVLVAQSILTISFLSSTVAAHPTASSSSPNFIIPAVAAAPLVDLSIPDLAHINAEASSSSTKAKASGSSPVNSWQLQYMPSTNLADLKKALHLEDSLGKDADFDVVPDPNPGSHAKRALSSKKHLVLRSIYPKNSYSQSKDKHASFTSIPLSTKAFAGSKAHFIRLEYQMMFQPKFNWVLGGKLPGILVGTEEGCGGNAGCSGGGTAENCFSTRMMWRAGGEGELYLYAAKSVYFPDSHVPSCKKKRRLMTRTDQEEEAEARRVWQEMERRRIDAIRLPEPDDEFALPLEKREDGSCLDGYKVITTPGSKNECNPSYGISIGRGGGFRFQSGTWHNITQVVRVNSAGNAVKDGYLAIYLDGKPVIQSSDLVLLKNGYDNSKNSNAHTVKFMFSSFFGGHSSQYKTPTKQWIAWKEFSMASSPTNLWTK